MNKLKNSARNKFAAAAIAIAMLSAAHITYAEDALPQYRPQVATAADAKFPPVERATRPQGVFVPARHIAMIVPGLRKSEIYTLLDVPHFHEGLFFVRRWNYIINFYTGRNDEYRQCQYQIQFDKHYRVESGWWKDRECADLFQRDLELPRSEQPAPNPSTSAPVPMVRQQAEVVSKSYSFTFDFDKAVISPEGQDVIAQVVRDADSGAFGRIVIVGFTDTVGAREYNDNLAARRAAAVSAELTQELGDAGSHLQSKVYARGGRDLAVATGPDVRNVDNRRVTIELYK